MAGIAKKKNKAKDHQNGGNGKGNSRKAASNMFPYTAGPAKKPGRWDTNCQGKQGTKAGLPKGEQKNPIGPWQAQDLEEMGAQKSFGIWQ